MKRKPNPIHTTVQNYVRGGKGRHFRYQKITLKSFFESLDRRGPLHPNSLFEKWVSTIRQDMVAAGSWTKACSLNQSDAVNFVQEYISRLQLQFWTTGEVNTREYKRVAKYTNHGVELPYWQDDLDWKMLKTFKMIYKMIRVFGLRMKLFYLIKARERRHMKYEYLIVDTVVAEYDFGRQHLEKARLCYRARNNMKLKVQMRFCAPLKMPIRF